MKPALKNVLGSLDNQISKGPCGSCDRGLFAVALAMICVAVIVTDALEARTAPDAGESK